MALPKVYTIATTVVTKSIKFIINHAPELGTAIGTGTTILLTKAGFNLKEKHETMEDYKGWTTWKQGGMYYAKKEKNKLKLKTDNPNDVRMLIDEYESRK